MMAPKRPDPIDRLLAGRPGLSVTEKEALLSSLLDKAEIGSRPRRSRRSRWAWSAAVCTASAGAVLIWLVMLTGERTPAGRTDGFTARGAIPDRPVFAALCHPEGGPCRAGDKLFFRVSAPADHNFLSAFATREDGLVIWYFPALETGRSLEVTPVDRPELLEQAVRLGPEHRPGHYRVTALWTAAPIDRPTARALIRSWPARSDEALRSDLDLEVDAR